MILIEPVSRVKFTTCTSKCVQFTTCIPTAGVFNNFFHHKLKKIHLKTQFKQKNVYNPYRSSVVCEIYHTYL